VTDARPRPAFAHASEAELARILDFYEVAWEYEPHTFPILYDRDGAVLESFSPDFYLPELELYVEITTLKQRLVRKKNRKLRRLRDLYPGLRVKLLYARDFRALLLKYGRISLADALSGAEGQATPPRRSGLDATPAAAPAAAPAPIATRADQPPAPATRPRSGRTRRTRAQARARAAARVTSAPLTETNA
jgi:hypoxanthine phosphoribosyltransferase